MKNSCLLQNIGFIFGSSDSTIVFLQIKGRGESCFDSRQILSTPQRPRLPLRPTMLPILGLPTAFSQSKANVA
jgi:hypothetical protein